MVEALRSGYRCIFDNMLCDRFVDDLNAGLCCSCSRSVSRKHEVV